MRGSDVVRHRGFKATSKPATHTNHTVSSSILTSIHVQALTTRRSNAPGSHVLRRHANDEDSPPHSSGTMGTTTPRAGWGRSTRRSLSFQDEPDLISGMRRDLRQGSGCEYMRQFPRMASPLDVSSADVNLQPLPFISFPTRSAGVPPTTGLLLLVVSADIAEQCGSATGGRRIPVFIRILYLCISV